MLSRRSGARPAIGRGQHLHCDAWGLSPRFHHEHRARGRHIRHSRGPRAVRGQRRTHFPGAGCGADRLHRLRRLRPVRRRPAGLLLHCVRWHHRAGHRLAQGVGLQPLRPRLRPLQLLGVAIVYTYFQLPLMVLVITPALEGLRPAWGRRPPAWAPRVAVLALHRGTRALPLVSRWRAPAVRRFAVGLCDRRGAHQWQHRALRPSRSARSSTATSSPGSRTSARRRLGMVVIIAVVMVFYVLLQRRASRWLR